MSNKEYYYPESLTIISTKCNLSCNYCRIGKTLNSFSNELFNNTIEYLENGQYLKNIEIAFNRLGYSLNNINEFQIWGQESSMILASLNKVWDKWQKKLPNLNKTMFSTNMTTNIDDIYNFIVNVNNNARQSVHITIQISYDGYIGTNQVRKASSDLIKENIHYLIKKINEIKLSNISEITLAYHGVISKEIFNNLLSNEQIEDYIKEINNFLENIDNITINQKIRNTPLTLMVVNGCNDISTEDGINLCNFIKKIDSQYYNFKEKYPYFYGPYGKNLVLDVLGPEGQRMIDDIKNNDNIKDFDELIDTYIKSNSYMRKTNTCLPLIGDFKMLYDGSTAFCQNSLHDIHLEEDQLTNSIFDQSRKYQMRNLKVNLIQDSIEDINKYKNYIEEYFNAGLNYTFLNQNMNFLYLLAQINQVSSSYLYDFKKLKRHAYLLGLYNSCNWNLTITTGSPDLRSIYDIRLLANGVLDLFEEAIESQVKTFV